MAVDTRAPAPAAGTAPGATGAGGPEKAQLIVDPEFAGKFPLGKPPSPRLECHYNPKELKISGGGSWSEAEANQSFKLAPALFVKPKPRTLTVQLLFDRYPDGNVEDELATLFDWTTPRRSALPAAGKASAPWLRFHWGSKHYFRCSIDSLNVSVTLFQSSGAAARATADVVLKELPDVLPFTNPTSGGEGGERSCRVLAGDTLHSIAHRHYGNPRLWRGLAALNGVDDPMRLATGSELGLPPADVVEELS